MYFKDTMHAWCRIIIEPILPCHDLFLWLQLIKVGSRLKLPV